MPTSPWIVCQLGAREHYAVARALHRVGALDALVTDLWVPPSALLGRLPGIRNMAGVRRLRGRFHPELGDARVLAPNGRSLIQEAIHRARRHANSKALLERYAIFQNLALAELERHFAKLDEPRTLFSYSNTAAEVFRFGKARGWRTVLGQVDPGPEEQRIVAAEQLRYAGMEPAWQPAPERYWQQWRDEIAQADRIIVNSSWSHRCLVKEGVPAEKLEIIPLVYDEVGRARPVRQRRVGKPLHVLFLGQITLRKGIGRLLDAMRMLAGQPVHLTMVGRTWINPAAWADLANVHWLGPVPRAEVDALYDAADVFILPTLSDGFALTQLEALARGLPVIASKNCGDAVVHGKNGWILDDLEPATIAAELIALDIDSLTGQVTIHGDFRSPDLAAALLMTP